MELGSQHTFLAVDRVVGAPADIIVETDASVLA